MRSRTAPPRRAAGCRGSVASSSTELVELGVVARSRARVPRHVHGGPRAGRRRAVLCSHGGCRALHDTPRNLDDDQLRALADAGGLFGLMLHPLAIDPIERTIDRVIDHLEHAAEVMGSDRVCLGGDFTRRIWEAMPAPPEPKDGLAPPGLPTGSGDRRPHRAPSTTRRSSTRCAIAAGARAAGRRSGGRGTSCASCDDAL